MVQKNDHSVGCYDLASGQEIRRIAVGSYPHEMAFVPSRRRAYCTLYGVPLAESVGPGGSEVVIVDTQALRKADTISILGTARPHGVAVDDHRGTVYVTCEHPPELLVFSIEDGSRPFARIGLSGRAPHNISLSRNGEFACVSLMGSDEVELIALGPDMSSRYVIKVGGRPEGSIFYRGRFFVVNRESDEISVIHPYTGSVEIISAPGGPVRICLGPCGMIFAAMYHAAELAKISCATLSVVERASLSAQPVSIHFDKSRNQCFLGSLADTIEIVDAGRMRRAGRIQTRSGPDAMFTV